MFSIKLHWRRTRVQRILEQQKFNFLKLIATLNNIFIKNNNMKIPEGYQAVMPCLIIKNAAKFLSFTQNVFNATEKAMHMRDEQIIMHGEITIGGSTIMFAEATDQFSQANAGMFVYVENADETYQKALDEGAISIMPPADQPYGRSSGVTDPFGNTWWITSVL